MEFCKDVFEHGANKLSLFLSENFNSAVAFLLLDSAYHLHEKDAELCTQYNFANVLLMHVQSFRLSVLMINKVIDLK